MEENENLIKTKNIMCLTLRNGGPYNNKKIRWKAVYAEFSPKDKQTRYWGKYTRVAYAKRGVWMTATKNEIYPDSKEKDIGFHVYITRKDARDIIKKYLYNNCTVIKVEVDGFNASGYYGYEKAETWKKMRIL